MNLWTSHVKKTVSIKSVAVALVLALLAGCGGEGSTGTESGIPSGISASISWASPTTKADGTSLTGDEIGGYLVLYGTSSGVYTTSVDVGNVTSYDFQGVASGNTYYIVVVAYDTLKDFSDYSEELRMTF